MPENKNTTERELIFLMILAFMVVVVVLTRVSNLLGAGSIFIILTVLAIFLIHPEKQFKLFNLLEIKEELSGIKDELRQYNLSARSESHSSVNQFFNSQNPPPNTNEAADKAGLEK